MFVHVIEFEVDTWLFQVTYVLHSPIDLTAATGRSAHSFSLETSRAWPPTVRSVQTDGKPWRGGIIVRPELGSTTFLPLPVNFMSCVHALVDETIPAERL